MAHLLPRANNPAQDGEILLSGFAHVALQVEAQRRLTRAGRARRGKKGQKKPPQRGLGVAQLEKIRLEEQRRATQQAQQLVSLHQIHGQALFYPHAPPGIIQHERESSHALVSPNADGSALVCFPSTTDGNATLILSGGSFYRSLIESPSKAGPMELFPRAKVLPRSMVQGSEGMWNNNLCCKVDDGSAESRQRLLGLGQNIEGQGRLGHPRAQLQDGSPVVDGHQSSMITRQMPIPSPSSLERMMELSSFQTVCRKDSSSIKRHQAGMANCIKRRPYAIVPPPSGCKLSEFPARRTLSVKGRQLATEDPKSDRQSHGARSNAALTDVCELTLRPPGAVEATLNPELENDGGGAAAAAASRQADQRCGQGRGGGLHNFLSLAVPGGTWHDTVAESVLPSTTPSPVSATTTKSSATAPETTEENISTPTTRWSTCSQSDEPSLVPPFSPSLDLTLRL